MLRIPHRLVVLSMLALTIVGSMPAMAASSPKPSLKPSAGLPPGSSPSILTLRTGLHGAITRFVLETNQPIPYRVLLLATPWRAVIDLTETAWKAPDAEPAALPSLISGYRFGLFHPGNSRVVIDLKHPVRLVRHGRLRPADGGDERWRIFIDLEPVPAVAFSANKRQSASEDWKPPPPPLPTPRTASKTPADTAGKTGAAGTTGAAAGATAAVPLPKARTPRLRRVIMLDPGHGGVDPGALGRGGTREKRITLKAAWQIKHTLEASGRYEVHMTRSSDRYRQLRERYRSAERIKAELFLSLHADSSPRPATRGASVYMLSETASDKEAARLAKRENRSDLIAGIDASTQLQANFTRIDMGHRHAKNEAGCFAAKLIRSLGKRIRLVNRTRREAGFAVLKSPKVPSVLLELGFLSNKTDEALLNRPAHLAHVATGILEALDTHFAGLEKCLNQV